MAVSAIGPGSRPTPDLGSASRLAADEEPRWRWRIGHGPPITFRCSRHAIKQRMGHADIGTTMNRYGHVLPSLEEQILDLLEEARSEALEVLAVAVCGPTTVIALSGPVGLLGNGGGAIGEAGHGATGTRDRGRIDAPSLHRLPVDAQLAELSSAMNSHVG